MKNLLIICLLTFNFQYSYSQIENCLEFNGYNNYVLVGDENNFGTSDFTIEAWVYFNQSFGYNGYKIISKGNTTVGTPSNAGYSLRGFCSSLGTDLDFTIGHSDGTIGRITYNGLNTNRWYHIAGVRSGRSISLYVDGELVASETYGFVFNVNTNIPLSIGSIHKAGLSRVSEFMNGKIDEVRFWNVSRTRQQLLDNKDCAIISPEENLTTVYNFDEIESNTTIDNSGNNSNGTLINNPIWKFSTVALQCSLIAEHTNLIDFINITNTSVFVTLNQKIESGYCFVYDISGRLIYMRSLIKSNTVAIYNLSKGMYVFKILNSNNELLSKVKFIQY